MQTVKQKLISFFEQAAQKDSCLLRKLKQQNSFKLDQQSWCFTLVQLHVFLQHLDDAFRCMKYREFQKLIFNSPLNQIVKMYGAEITIINNQGKVSKSTYALVWEDVKFVRS